MDYTTLPNVKAVLGADAINDDALVTRLITEASRVIDRHCAGGLLKVDNYFLQEAITGELITGQVDSQGRVLCHPHKPLVTSVSAAAYRFQPTDSFQDVSVASITVDGYAVRLWDNQPRRGKVQVKISYTGGLAATVASLPGDLTNAADLLTVRFYREIKSGLSDSIGVAELGTLQYTKALPARLIEMLKPYRRIVA